MQHRAYSGNAISVPSLAAAHSEVVAKSRAPGNIPVKKTKRDARAVGDTSVAPSKFSTPTNFKTIILLPGIARKREESTV